MKVGKPKKTIIVREYQLEIGKVQVFDDYMIAIFDEGTTIDVARFFQILGIIEIHFRGRNFGFISLRKFSYAIDPMIYNQLREIDNLKALAVVSLKEIDMHNFNIEKLFYKKNMKFFIDTDNALAWVKRRVRA
ncbi:MAG: STAS/SEC14 domain-containing protein [Arenibacter sp.]|uniref:STAS/SEC14 domain-containing protein n=1 Tax=Arenibacter TaxID=178469 RepID=UPI000A3B231F|nr:MULTISPECIES: STAS/SEC14 domain-containing protein [Arenibacter]MDX1326700.1 STAS/SEC14 domain-containing protein [Arenibacter sp.]